MTDNQYDREESAIIDAFNEGRISREEYNTQMRDLQRDARDEEREDRERAHEELDRLNGWDGGRW